MKIAAAPQIHAMPPNDQDRDIVEMAQARLRDSSCFGDARDLRCEYHEGVLVLRGQVSSYYHKQVAQETVRNLRGVVAVHNFVEVILRAFP